jgi:hypothetical protein
LEIFIIIHIIVTIITNILIGSCGVAQVGLGLEPVIFLPQPPECWDYRCIQHGSGSQVGAGTSPAAKHCHMKTLAGLESF